MSRDRWLFLPQTKLEVQTVSPRHKSPCVRCDYQFAVGDRRFQIVRGSGRHQKSYVLCAVCGGLFLNMAAECLKRTGLVLCGETDDVIRTKAGDPYGILPSDKVMKAKRDARKQAKAKKKGK
jgi:hypothetical protein